jgi:hypothetical protein
MATEAYPSQRPRPTSQRYCNILPIDTSSPTAYRGHTSTLWVLASVTIAIIQSYYYFFFSLKLDREERHSKGVT